MPTHVLQSTRFRQRRVGMAPEIPVTRFVNLNVNKQCHAPIGIHTMLALTLCTMLAAGSATGQAGEPVVADVVLKNATLVDGTGQPSRQGDLAIKGDKIVGVGSFKVAGTPRVLDCT